MAGVYTMFVGDGSKNKNEKLVTCQIRYVP